MPQSEAFDIPLSWANSQLSLGSWFPKSGTCQKMGITPTVIPKGTGKLSNCMCCQEAPVQERTGPRLLPYHGLYPLILSATTSDSGRIVGFTCFISHPHLISFWVNCWCLLFGKEVITRIAADFKRMQSEQGGRLNCRRASALSQHAILFAWML